MSGRPEGVLLYIHSEPIRDMCATYGTSLFTYNEMNKLNNEYTLRLHKKLIAYKLINKHHDGYITYGERRCHVNYYSVASRLIDWHHINFVALKGRGKLGKMERDKRKAIIT